MTTITTDISWAGSWSRLYTDPKAYNSNIISNDAQSSSVSTAATSDDGDTVVLSEEAQKAVNFDEGAGSGGLDAVSAIYTAAATVINDSTSTDKEKIAAFGAAYTMSVLSNSQTIDAAQANLSSYGAKFQTLEDGFFKAIAGSSLMKTFASTPVGAPDSDSDFQKALSDILTDAGGISYGTDNLSVNLQEITTQAADGSLTTSYSFSYVQTGETEAGTQDPGAFVDPMSAFSGAATAKSKEGAFVPYGSGSALAVSSGTTTITFENPQAKLAQEIADELFGSSKAHDKTAGTGASNNTQTTQNDSADEGNYWVN